MVTDTIANLLTCIRNAVLKQHKNLIVTYSKINFQILIILKKKKYIETFIILEEFSSQLHPTPLKKLKIVLKYKGWWNKIPMFTILKRISKPGKRIFSKYTCFATKIPELRYNQGLAIISTSSGIIDHLQAISLKKGGEILFYLF